MRTDSTFIIDDNNHLIIKNVEKTVFLLNLVKTQHLLGKQALINNAISSFPKVKEDQINVLIKELCEENKIQILDPKAKPEAQLICLVPRK